MSKNQNFKGSKHKDKRDIDPKSQDEVISKSKKGKVNPKNYGTFRSCNDIKWYSQNPELMKTSSQISYGQILGLANTIEYSILSGDRAGEVVATSDYVPGIMAIKYIPGIGVSNSPESNINVAARLAYTFMRHANSGSRNYESADYMTYLLGVGNAQAYFAWMVRLYGLINHSSVQNRYKVKSLVTAAGGDYTDLVNKMAAFHYYINYYGNKINSFAVPKDQYIFDRMTFLPLHVFTDGDNPKSQMYIFKPEGYYRWTGTKYETGSALEFVPFSGSATLEDIIDYGNNLLQALLSNEDIGMMSGDTLKAYKSDGIRQVTIIDAAYTTPIIKDDGMLAQIHNAVSLPNGSALSNLDITQIDGELLYAVRGRSMGYPGMETIYLDSWISEPDPTYNMEATRLITLVKPVVGYEDADFEVETSGTEIITEFDIYTFNEYGTMDITHFNNTKLSLDGIDSEIFVNAKLLANVSKFDWHPLLYVTNGGKSDLAEDAVSVIGDLQNYTLLDKSVVDRMHNCAIQSLFNVFGLYIKTY